jgi:FKBP-type peptidyl-prolyl cis-trans isomerase
MENKKNMMLVWVLIVIVVVLGLIYITINKKSSPRIENGAEETNMENTQNSEGVKITILKEGTGEVSKAGDLVSVNYTGTLVDGKTFDSNIDPKFQHVQPFDFTLGVGQVIKGWDVGVAGMKIGEKRKLEILPEFAYGPNGIGDAIPPNATLIFEVELLAIKK